METTEAINCTLNGQTEAFEALVVRYQRPVFTFLLGMGVSSTLVEDIAQDVFLSAYVHLKTFNADQSQFSTWLFAIAKNKAINHMRKKRLKSFFGFSNEVLDPAIGFAEVGGCLEGEERRLLLLNCISSLQSEYRSSCLLYFYNDLKIEQIAEIEKCSQGTIKSRLFRAKQLLKEKLKGSFYES